VRWNSINSYRPTKIPGYLYLYLYIGNPRLSSTATCCRARCSLCNRKWELVCHQDRNPLHHFPRIRNKLAASPIPSTGEVTGKRV